MPNELTLPITPGQLPSGFCPSSEQERWNTFAAYGSVVFPSTFAGIVLSSTKPSDTTKAWGQLDQNGRLLRIYNFANGQWVSLHTIQPGLTQWWFKALPDFNTFDGGDSNPIGDTSGPMWQLAKDLNGNEIQWKFPVTKGTLPSGTVLVIGDIGGEEKHALTADENGKHTHDVGYISFSDSEEPGGDLGLTPVGSVDTGTRPTKESGLGTAHNNMPPFVVGCLLERTTRLFFSVT